MAWMDNTGLYQKYGLEQVVPQVAGEYRFDGPQRLMEIKLDLTTLTNTAAVISGTDSVNFPANFIIDKVEVFAETLAAGATATLSVGLQRTDRTTAIDYNGILNAAPLANMDTTGETTVYSNGVAGAGNFVGKTVGANPGYLTANWNTAAFTAGVVIIRIYYHK